MGRSYTSYVELLKALLPRGRAWIKDAGDLPKLLEGLSKEPARIEATGESLIEERDTRTANYLLAEHEIDLGLATTIAGAPGTLAERRLAAHAQATAVGGQDPAYFVALAANLGYIITIKEFRPAWCGVVVCGDSCGDQDVLFVWLVKVAYSRDYIDPTATDLQELFNRLRPGHTVVIFSLVSPGFSRGFSAGFNAMPALTSAQLAVGGFRYGGFTKGYNIKYGGGFRYGAFSSGFNTLK